MAEALPLRQEIVFEYGVARELAPGLARLVAPNPGPLTHKGTNTYLIGHERLAVVDPGPQDEGHLAAILRAAAGRPITHILLTHTHLDHSAGLEALRAATGAEVLGYGRMATARLSPATDTSNRPGGKPFIDWGFAPDRLLADGEIIAAGDVTLEAVHTPGHAPDHLCFAFLDQPIVLTGDHVMAWNTSVVAPPEGHMGDYLQSLMRLSDRQDTFFAPGHGGRVLSPQRVVKAYLMHRRWREAAILEALRDGAATVPALMPRIYGHLAQHLQGAAALSLLAHLEHLVEAGVAGMDPPLALDGQFWAL